MRIVVTRLTDGSLLYSRKPPDIDSFLSQYLVNLKLNGGEHVLEFMNNPITYCQTHGKETTNEASTATTVRTVHDGAVTPS